MSMHLTIDIEHSAEQYACLVCEHRTRMHECVRARMAPHALAGLCVRACVCTHALKHWTMCMCDAGVPFFVPLFAPWLKPVVATSVDPMIKQS